MRSADACYCEWTSSLREEIPGTTFARVHARFCIIEFHKVASCTVGVEGERERHRRSSPTYRGQVPNHQAAQVRPELVAAAESCQRGCHLGGGAATDTDGPRIHFATSDTSCPVRNEGANFLYWALDTLDR